MGGRAGSGFRVQGAGYRVQGSGHRVQSAKQERDETTCVVPRRAGFLNGVRVQGADLELVDERARTPERGHGQRREARLFGGVAFRIVQRFPGGLVFKAHRLSYHSTLGRVTW